MSEQTIWHVVADLKNPNAEPFAVLRVDTSVRSGDGVEGTVMSLHWSRDEAEERAKELDEDSAVTSTTCAPSEIVEGSQS